MLRTVLAALPAALVVAVSWGRLDESGAPVLAAMALALVPALLPRLALRLAAFVPALVATVWLAFDVSPLEARPRDETHDFFGPVWSRAGDGLLGFYDVRLPFSAAEEPAMQGIVVLAVFGFCAVLGLAVASREPLPALLALLAGAGWPVTLYPVGGVLYGSLVLAAALWLLAALRVETPTPALAAGGLVVLAASVLSTSPAVAKDAVLDWQRWEPYGVDARPVSVDFVWDASYRGVDFPRRKTTVLRVRGPERSVYWRATTLDRFTDDHWIEVLNVVATDVTSGPLPEDALLPPAARKPANWTRQEVEVVGLTDEHLLGATTPVALETRQLRDVDLLTGGILRARAPLERGRRYVIDSYSPRPAAATLATLAPDYPPALGRYLQLDRTTSPAFGSPGRADRLSALFEDERFLPLWPYEGMYRRAEQLAEGAIGPYGAVVAIETWLRSTGGFTYDEEPPPAAGVPPLVHFVGEGRRGYCQHFAGAMTLMLRLLGIPARVAAGFTSGSYERGVWTVTDRNAHVWVEVWFPRFGWLAFDPTPGRGEIGADYTASSDSFNAGDAANAAFARGRGAGGPDPGGVTELGELIAARERATATRGITVRDEGVGTVTVLLALAAAVGAAIGLAKLARRRLRYLTRDSRRLAAAARLELADFLADQRLAVSASATPAELGAAVRERFGIDARAFSNAVARARYGPPASGAEAAELARAEVRSLLRLLRRSLSRAQRLRGYVALRSLRA